MPITVRFSAVLAITFALLVGCRPAPQPADSNATAVTTSSVPLRLWIVRQVSDVSMVQRQWQTGSEQPIEIRTLSVDELLAEPNTDCDVLVYPSRLVGELIDRKWIVKLPSALAATVNPTGRNPSASRFENSAGASLTSPSGADSASSNSVEPDDATSTPLPVAWLKTATYNGDLWGIPLGTSFPVIVTSDLDHSQELVNLTWDELLTSHKIGETRATEVDLKAIDRAALVDRFFALVASLTDRTPDYGVLFELQSMKPRLTEPEFIRAAEILARLASQSSIEANTSLQSVVGDSSAAWMWAASQDTPALAIVAPSMLTVEAAQLSKCRPLSLQNAIAWNTGSGLIASMSANCRQSARAALLLRWLGEKATRQALAPLIPGIESSFPIAGTDSTAWQAAGLARELSTSDRATHELRLPRAEEYRQVLAENLIKVISGESRAADALDATNSAWQTITDARGRLLQRTDYEHSLGLSHR